MPGLKNMIKTERTLAIIYYIVVENLHCLYGSLYNYGAVLFMEKSSSEME